MLDAGKIKARTKWKEVYPHFSKDERYLTLLGTPGSNPLELFWDVVDILDEALEHHAYAVEKVMKAKGVTFTTDMSEEDFGEVGGDEEVAWLL